MPALIVPAALAASRGVNRMNVIKQLRIELGLSQMEVSRETGISRSRLQVIENDFKEPTKDQIKALKEFFGESIQIHPLSKKLPTKGGNCGAK